MFRNVGYMHVMFLENDGTTQSYGGDECFKQKAANTEKPDFAFMRAH